MTLTEALASMADRVEKVVAASPKAAIALLKYPDLLENEPDLVEFVKRVIPHPPQNDYTKPG